MRVSHLSALHVILVQALNVTLPEKPPCSGPRIEEYLPSIVFQHAAEPEVGRDCKPMLSFSQRSAG